MTPAPSDLLLRHPARHLKPLVVVGMCGLLGSLACGPSIQSIHEGSVRFEHCYRLDLDPKIAPAHRHACWEQWLKIYSFGQSKDRLEHARERVAALEAGDPNPPMLDLETGAPTPTRQFYMSTPTPVSVHASPPPVATLAPAAPQEPTDACVALCSQAKASCLSRCAEGDAEGADAVERKTQPRSTEKPKTQGSDNSEGGKESADSKCDCEREYKLCGARCFE